ncbi:CHAT domain-containing protein [Leptolyngbya sp. FACHB-321]|uniref:CHAT domain-containing tetratricopeptide repeat protein n=1 Tax=Leptolyngbya sp. FACHB-321 TaxID=2692807 RepID=UPI001683450A|nr:CHAT domain-containing protein [Leptolyngbya sp. FACHB-321]
MQPSPQRIKASKRNVRLRFLLPLALCFLPVTVCLPPHAPPPAVAQTIDARKAEANRLSKQGQQLLDAGRVKEAIAAFEAALKLYQSIDDRAQEGAVLVILGYAYDSLEQFAKALGSYQQAAEVFRQVDDRKAEGMALTFAGRAYADLGQLAKALETAQAALVITRQTGDRMLEATNLSNIGGIYTRWGQYAKAAEFLEASLKVARQIDPNAGGVILLNLGSVYENLGQYPKALEFYQQALEGFQRIDAPVQAGMSLTLMGLIYTKQSQYAKAITTHQQALQIIQQSGYRTGEGAILSNIGDVYQELGQSTRALEFYERSLRIAQQISNREGESMTLNNMGNAYMSLGQRDKALTVFEQALKILQQSSNLAGESRTLINIGTISYELEQHTNAMKHFQSALKIAQQIGNRESEKVALANVGMVYNKLRQYSQAQESFQQALKIAQQTDDRLTKSLILTGLGQSLAYSGSINAAEKALYEAIEIVESLRGGLKDRDKVFLANRLVNPYLWLQLTLVVQNKTTAALEVAERGRTRAFVELLATRLAGDSMPPQTLQRLGQPLSLPQIQQVARQQNATLVEYSVVGGALYIWVIRPTGQIEFRKTRYKFSTTELQELVSVTHDVLRRGVRRSGTTPTSTSQPTNVRLDQFGAYQLRTLHQMLIEPIADLLPKNPSDRVIFIPQNELLLVPFPALLNEKGTYLIEQHTLLTAPSIQVLSFTDQNQQQLNRTPNRTALVVGNPTLPKLSEGGLVPLPAAEQEARTVAQLLKTTPLIGAAATKAAVLNQMPQARFIHLATHGLLTTNSGNAPGAIVLAPNSPNQVDDGLLTPTEILNMKLKAELVVLSACDTAQGDVTSDGIVGLSRSLIAAGVPSVIVSLWAVPDAPTAELMQTFYLNLQKQPDKAQALRQAMLTTMTSHPQPRDWAAFTLIGEAE